MRVGQELFCDRSASIKIILSFALFLAVLTGCDLEKINRDNLSKRTASLYEIYFNGSRDDARQSLQEAARLLEGAKLSASFEEGRAFTLFLVNGRLHALERRAGSNDMAQVYLVKARFWALRSEELHGDSPAECIVYLEKFASEEKLMPFIDKWDKDANKGNSPRYIQAP
jgi:hypothetical protein